MARFTDFDFSHSVYESFMNLKVDPNICQLTYVYIDGTGETLRSKMKVHDSVPKSVEEVPLWYAGDFKHVKPTHSEIVVDFTLKPVALYNDPFLRGNNKLVLCSLNFPDGGLKDTNYRDPCLQTLKKAEKHEPWFGFEQEYTLMERDFYPAGWPKGGYPPANRHWFCTVGTENVVGRRFLNAHVQACLHAGVKIAGSMVEGFPSQFEYQVGICEGIRGGDDLWMSRYILQRLGEEFGVVVTLDPKPLPQEDFLGSGCHANFSTKQMREKGGLSVVLKGVEKLGGRHKEHLEVYGSGNERRLVGKAFASSYETFTSAVDDRKCSVRVPKVVEVEGCGYLEDRRPSSNCDPYRVIEAMVNTVCIL